MTNEIRLRASTIAKCKKVLSDRESNKQKSTNDLYSNTSSRSRTRTGTEEDKPKGNTNPKNKNKNHLLME